MPKIVVYAIAKDEEASARAWAEAVKEADHVVVLDTGSTDRTPEIFREYGFSVFSDFAEPFRFDRARNHALSHVPADADWCFSVDIDEIFEPGWRAAIEKAAAENPNATQIKYPFIFSHRPDPETGEEIDDHVFYKGNCHARRGFKWVCPCHEVLVSELTAITARADGCRLHHRSGAKDRRVNYLTILENGAKTDPKDPRVHYYLGREYLYRRQFKKAGETLARYLELVGEYCWHDERGNAVLMIAEACKGLNDLDRAESWALRALAETAGREPYLFLARLYYEQRRWWECRHYAESALRIEDNHAYFRRPAAYRAEPWDIISAAAYRLGDRERAKEAAAKCLEIEPENERYQFNARFFAGQTTTTRSADPASAANQHALETAPEQELAVAYSITRDFTEILETALFSLLKFNRVRDLYLLIEGGKIDQGISRLAKAGGVRRVHWIDLEELNNEIFLPDSPNRKPTASMATYGRLYLPRVTKEEKILYLDADTIVHGSLAELWDTPFDGAAMIGVLDKGIHKEDYTKTLAYGGIPGYINTGVLMMNLDAFRALDLDRAALELLQKTYYAQADQDVLNIVGKGRTRPANVKFNSGLACGTTPDPLITHLVCIRDFWTRPIWQAAKFEYDSFKKSELTAPPTDPAETEKTGSENFLLDTRHVKM